MESITALDGTVLDFTHIQNAPDRLIRKFIGTIYADRDAIFYGEALSGDLNVVRASALTIWFISQRGKEDYVGVCYYGTAEDNTWVSMEVAISETWRLNGYGRAAFVAMCERLEALADDHVVVVPKGKNDDFCKSMDMYERETMWVLPIKEVLCV